MTVKEFIERLQKENQELNVVFNHELFDDNFRGCNIDEDDINKEDLIIYPLINQIWLLVQVPIILGRE